ncbi:MAG: molybdopterin-dependent oxidoreductase [Candidatus Latescibacterota bacterium]|nr:MAG: molybdopterin-dependent oxidoreductase [Candidatus Latescibacterota bacterium]
MQLLLRTVVLARAPDGYEVVFALAELEEDFTGQSVLLAVSRDGESLPTGEGPLRIVVPWEHRGGRWIRQVNEIEVRILR